MCCTITSDQSVCLVSYSSVQQHIVFIVFAYLKKRRLKESSCLCVPDFSLHLLNVNNRLKKWMKKKVFHGHRQIGGGWEHTPCWRWIFCDFMHRWTLATLLFCRYIDAYRKSCSLQLGSFLFHFCCHVWHALAGSVHLRSIKTKVRVHLSTNAAVMDVI